VGGITLTFSGDFSQTLPVIVKETRADIRIWPISTEKIINKCMRGQYQLSGI